MKIRWTLIQACLLVVVLLALPVVTQAQGVYLTNGFAYLIATNDNAITIRGWNSPSAGITLNIPDSIYGMPVNRIGPQGLALCGMSKVIIPNTITSIGTNAFGSCSGLTNIVLGTGITNIEYAAFYGCTKLSSVYFKGNAPVFNGAIFYGDTKATVYYSPGTTGWSLVFGGAPTVMWNPQTQTGDGFFGVQNNQFGFNIIGSSNLVIVVEASTDLINPAWIPVSTNTLNNFVGTNGMSYFSDSQWTNYPGRFYRFRSP